MEIPTTTKNSREKGRGVESSTQSVCCQSELLPACQRVGGVVFCHLLAKRRHKKEKKKRALLLLEIANGDSTVNIEPAPDDSQDYRAAEVPV